MRRALPGALVLLCVSGTVLFWLRHSVARRQLRAQSQGLPETKPRQAGTRSASAPRRSPILSTAALEADGAEQAMEVAGRRGPLAGDEGSDGGRHKCGECVT